MRHSHSHCSHHEHEKADIWTTLSGAGEFVTDYASSTYWFASFFDLVTNAKSNNILKISWYGLAFGTVIALIPTIGSTYSHWILNKNHQHDHRHVITQTKLSIYQKFFLAGDLVGHTMDSAGAAKTIIDAFSKIQFSKGIKIGFLAGSILFGILTSIANVRTCKRNMVSNDDHGTYQNHHDEKSDIWTVFSGVGEFVTSYATIAYWFASFFDLITDAKGNNILNVSWYGLAFGSVIALIPTIGSTYSHWILNRNHQHDPHHKHPSNTQTKLSTRQKFFLAGDLAGHSMDSAGVAMTITDAFSKSNFSRGAKIAVIATSIPFGIFSSIANVRTCKKNMVSSNATSGENVLLIQTNF